MMFRPLKPALNPHTGPKYQCPLFFNRVTVHVAVWLKPPTEGLRKKPQLKWRKTP